MKIEAQMIDAEDGEDFQIYYFNNGDRVKAGTRIGVEIYNPRLKKWELKLFNDIRFWGEKMRYKHISNKIINGIWRKVYREYNKNKEDRFYYYISNRKIFLNEV